MKKKYQILAGMLITVIIAGCTTVQTIPPPQPMVDIPPVAREFRAAWVASVANIDWPSKPGLSSAEQQAEALAILDSSVALNLNAIVLQVRPQCDALYPSQLEPWSYYLTGRQGTAPEPFYDPLQFWLNEAHDRGLELHVWFNPYRAHHPSGDSLRAESVVNTHPELVKKMENGYYWLNPTHPGTQQYSFDVVMDVLRRYDVDGIHFDDYFYPYGDGNFPDDDTWQAYGDSGGELGREDWRRDSVNRFIEKLYRAIKSEKPWVKFGISPFGIWRPGNPPSIQGFDQYRMLYADARLWLREGWVDYFTPQLYWPISQVPQSFPVLLGWWHEENIKNRHLWPGMYTSRFTRDSVSVVENSNQIMITRGFDRKTPGHIHFSMKALLNNRNGVSTALKQGPYANPALVPASPWLDNSKPELPDANVQIFADSLEIKFGENQDTFRRVVYLRYGNDWEHRIFNRNDSNIRLAMYKIIPARSDRRTGEITAPESKKKLTRLAVTAVDRSGNESERKLLMLPAEN